MAANLPIKRITLQEKLARFHKLSQSTIAKVAQITELIKLNPEKAFMKKKLVLPKMHKMTKSVQVINHKIAAVGEINSKSPIDEGVFERHLDRALAAAELLDGLVDDTLSSLQSA